MHLDRKGNYWTKQTETSRVLSEEKMDEIGGRLQHFPQESVKTACLGAWGLKAPGFKLPFFRRGTLTHLQRIVA
jgi:hypothetical protein